MTQNANDTTKKTEATPVKAEATPVKAEATPARKKPLYSAVSIPAGKPRKKAVTK
jgi:hypothetical protein